MSWRIERYTGGRDPEIADLILSIQNGEAGLHLTVEDQPDLLDIARAYAAGGFWVAIDNDRIVGTIGLLPYGRRAALKKFFVVAAARGREGPSRALFDAAMAFAEMRGFEDVFLDTPSRATRSHAFYRRAGFVPADRASLPPDYAFPDRDSLIFRRPLTDASTKEDSMTTTADPPALTLTPFPAGPNGFFRAPVLIEGLSEALLVDAGFTYSDGRALADAIAATGKKLTAIYISQSDPDYYFSLQPIRAAFPDARVIAASDTCAAIAASLDKKLATWGPQLGDNGPQARTDIVMPEAFDGDVLFVDGERVEIVATDGLANRRYLWVPPLGAVVGGVLIFSGVHVWTADTPTPDARAAWIATLDRIAARGPATVVPGHMAVDAATDLSTVSFTRRYLLAFEEELAKRPDAAQLAAAMRARFPGLGMDVALDIGTKVATGEMAWG